MDDILKSMFGFPRNRNERSHTDDFRPPPFGFPMHPPQDGEHSHDQEEFHHFNGDVNDMFRHFDEMFRSFNGLFRDMGIAEFPSPPAIPPPEQPHQGGNQPGAARDYMLKEPDSRQQPHSEPGHQPFFGGIWSMPGFPAQRQVAPEDKIDRDLDSEDIDLSLIPQPGKRMPTPPQPELRQEPHHSFSRSSVSIRTYKNINGQVEEERVVRDGSGSEERTVTRTVDGQTHSVTTRTTPAGDQEVSENFTNMDEKDKDLFEKKFHQPSHSQQDSLTNNDMIVQSPLDDKGMFSKIFGSFFS